MYRELWEGFNLLILEMSLVIHKKHSLMYLMGLYIQYIYHNFFFITFLIASQNEIRNIMLFLSMVDSLGNTKNWNSLFSKINKCFWLQIILIYIYIISVSSLQVFLMNHNWFEPQLKSNQYHLFSCIFIGQTRLSQPQTSIDEQLQWILTESDLKPKQ